MPVYPLTPNPDDIMKTLETDRSNLLFTDIHVRGKYPSYVKRIFKENNIEIKMEPGGYTDYSVILYRRYRRVDYACILKWQGLE